MRVNLTLRPGPVVPTTLRLYPTVAVITVLVLRPTDRLYPEIRLTPPAAPAGDLVLTPDVVELISSLPRADVAQDMLPGVVGVTSSALSASVSLSLVLTPDVATVTMGVPDVTVTALALAPDVVAQTTTVLSASVSHGPVTKLMTVARMTSQALNPTLVFGGITLTPSVAGLSVTEPSASKSFGPLTVTGLLVVTETGTPLSVTVSHGTAAKGSADSAYCRIEALSLNLAIDDVIRPTISNSRVLMVLPDPTVSHGTLYLLPDVPALLSSVLDPAVSKGGVLTLPEAVVVRPVPLDPTVVHERILTPSVLGVSSAPQTATQAKNDVRTPSVIAFTASPPTVILHFGAKTLTPGVTSLEATVWEAGTTEFLGNSNVANAYCVVTHDVTAPCLITEAIDARCIVTEGLLMSPITMAAGAPDLYLSPDVASVSASVADPTRVQILTPGVSSMLTTALGPTVHEIPIYVDEDIVLPSLAYVTVGERDELLTDLRSVTKPYKYLSSLNVYDQAVPSGGLYGWKQACDNYVGIVGSRIMGNMEHPWVTIESWDQTSIEAISPGATQLEINDWSIHPQVAQEFARCVALGVPGVTALVPAVPDGSGGWTSNCTNPVAMFKIVQAKLWNDAHDYAVVTKGAAACSQYSGMGVSLIEGTTRVLRANLHLSSQVNGIAWVTGDPTFYRTMENAFTHQGLYGACLQSMAASHLGGGVTNPWMPSLYYFYPTGPEYGTLIGLWSMGDSPPVHRMLGLAQADPPDFDPVSHAWGSASTFRRYLSGASAALVAGTGDPAQALDGVQNKVWPVLFPSACPPESSFVDSATLGSQHVIGLWSDPHDRAEVHAAMLDAETEVAAASGLAHVNPAGVMLWDFFDLYWLDTLVKNWATSSASVQRTIDASRVGWEKMLGLLPMVGPGEPVGGTSLSARSTYFYNANLKDAFWKAGVTQKFWTVAGGDQTGRGWDPFSSLIGQYLDPTADVGQPEVVHAIARFGGRRNVDFVLHLRTAMNARIS